jgi:ribosomal protein L29
MSVKYKVNKGIKQTITEMSDEELQAQANKYKGELWASAYMV